MRTLGSGRWSEQKHRTRWLDGRVIAKQHSADAQTAESAGLTLPGDNPMYTAMLDSMLLASA